METEKQIYLHTYDTKIIDNHKYIYGYGMMDGVPTMFEV
jgi:hypothetical protein